MLKALELVGFKSFADKTRFEFPPGITVVVGPNGSGKSNIVDAIKWVLGEQSAKSLRGQEMADVIFKGSGGGGRRSMNTAEATLTFDNSRGLLAMDSPEVHVTRRVYRSGEGEYLINGQPSRLRDIRDLFRGTGAGVGAYSLIEQGKVDAVLSASPHERRAIFEEAAGISRFKAKKVEAARRLERVEQNLLRLSDIIDEVESRLRGVKSQAGKTRRYKEYTERLQDLRTHVSQVDWNGLTNRLEETDSRLIALRDRSQAIASEAESVESRALEFETQTEAINEAIRTREAEIGANRERITARESAVRHERRRVHELEEAISRYRVQLAKTSTRAGDLQSQLRETSEFLRNAELERARFTEHLSVGERELATTFQQHQTVRDEIEAQRREHLEKVNASAALAKELSSAESQSAASSAMAVKCHKRLGELNPLCAAQQATLEKLSSTEPKLAEQHDVQRRGLDELRKNLDSQQQLLKSHQNLSLQLQRELASCRERSSVLKELDQRLEGVNRGVKDILARARNASSGPYTDVLGLVADLLQVRVEFATLVEIALGDVTHHVVIRGETLWDQLRRSDLELTGRVGLLRMDCPVRKPAAQRIKLMGRPGVLGRADQFVALTAPIAELVQHLLSDTWFVETLTDAFDLADSYPGRFRFVTRSGELMEADGTVFVGPRQHPSGIISRRSELRALREKLMGLEARSKDVDEKITDCESLIGDENQRLRRDEKQFQITSRTLDEQRLRLGAATERFEQLDKQRQSAADEMQLAERQRAAADAIVHEKRARLEKVESQLSDLSSTLSEAGQRLEIQEQQRHQKNHAVTAAKVELAKSQLRMEGLRAAMARFERDQAEREKAIRDARDQLATCVIRRRQSDRTILNAGGEIAELYLANEAIASKSVRLFDDRRQIGMQRTELAQQAQELRRQLRKSEESIHLAELEAGQARHERATLEDRLRDEYDIELARLSRCPSAEDARQRAEIEGEIGDLRRKINNIGAVNMHALAELEQLESRFDTLSEQLHDLTAAKDSLERIIRKINADSRRLFTETLEAISENFRTLFRKAFGGGRADLVLEDDVDILDSGIEIVATPPGKHSLGLSLLSGGERALAAVTLLLAVFQFRPSPFCVLDEVDGPLDEANVERFTGVLKDFLNWTKFVVVTHSKKTMTAATTLYGVTMQESGISKRVSVQFDDVSEDGHIRDEVLATADDSDDDGSERGAA